jgi:hypothetical protein
VGVTVATPHQPHSRPEINALDVAVLSDPQRGRGSYELVSRV